VISPTVGDRRWVGVVFVEYFATVELIVLQEINLWSIAVHVLTLGLS